MNFNKISLVIVFSILLFFLGKNTGIFWDNVLFVSKMGNPLYTHGLFSWLSIPLESDPGHPPFTAMLMALSWSLFGKSLFVSHLTMLPFVVGVLWQLMLLIRFFIEDLKLQLLAFLLVVSDPTLLSQLTLIGPEAILLFFFLLALNAILRKKRYLKLIALSFLGIITLRGMMLCGGLFLLDFTLSYQEKGKHFTIKMIKPYIIASLPAISYLIWRLMYRGYISSHPLETYGNAWGYASVSDFMRNFLRNGIVAFQRISDFGRIVPLIFIAYALYTKKERLKSKPVKVLLLSSILPILIVLVTSLIIKNPMGHRYFIPSYISLILLSFILLQDFKLKKFLYLGLMISLLLGNFIVYPDRFAQGWDASLAHLPYWQLRTQAITYISEEGIALKDVGTFFPNYNSIDEIDLNGNKASFSTFSGKNDYVLYSNVFNLTDAEFELLSEQYRIIQTFSKRQVRIELLKKISPTQEANTANVPLP